MRVLYNKSQGIELFPLKQILEWKLNFYAISMINKAVCI